MPPYDNSPQAPTSPAPSNRQRMPEGWGTRLDEHGRPVYYFDGFLVQARAPGCGPTNTTPPRREPLGARSRERDEQACGDELRELEPYGLRQMNANRLRQPAPVGADTPPRQPSASDERGTAERGSTASETKKQLHWVFPSGLGANCAAVTSKQMTGLVLRDATSPMNGSWDVKDLGGATRFRFCRESDSKSKFNEVQGEGFSWMYATSEPVWKRHAGVILLKVREKNDTMLTIVPCGGQGPGFSCWLGAHDSRVLFCSTKGSIREGTLQVSATTDRDPVAEVIQPEFNPCLRVKEGEYVLYVKPGFNVALACAVVLLVDTIHRKEDGRMEAHPSCDTAVSTSRPMYLSKRPQYPSVPLAISDLPRPPGAAGAIDWARAASLVLRDGLWGEDGRWDILDLDRKRWFRYFGVSDAPSGHKELWRPDGYGAYAATDSVLLMRSTVLAMNANNPSHVRFCVQEKRSANVTHFERETRKYLSAEGNVRDGTLIISETHGFSAGNMAGSHVTPFAGILRPELSPGLRINEGEYVLVVEPMRDLDVACAIALLVDSVQRVE